MVYSLAKEPAKLPSLLYPPTFNPDSIHPTQCLSSRFVRIAPRKNHIDHGDNRFLRPSFLWLPSWVLPWVALSKLASPPQDAAQPRTRLPKFVLPQTPPAPTTRMATLLEAPRTLTPTTTVRALTLPSVVLTKSSRSGQAVFTLAVRLPVLASLCVSLIN